MQVVHAVPQTPPLPLPKVCVCGKEREIPALGGPKMVETQTHLDMAKMDR